MKQLVCMLLAMCLMVCAMAGCAGGDPEVTSISTQPSQTSRETEETTLPMEGKETELPETTGETEAPETTEPSDPTLPQIQIGQKDGKLSGNSDEDPIEGDAIALAQTGKTRITYQQSLQRGVRYITCAEELPEEACFAEFDDAWFAENALILVCEILGSGSVQVDIESVNLVNGCGEVTLSKTMQGEYGTSDMAAWLLWTRVDPGMDVDWVLTGQGIGTGNLEMS